VTFGFVVAALVAAWLLGATLGGWKFGSFFRQVEFALDGMESPAFLQRLYRRVAELGFVSTGRGWRIHPGRRPFEDVGATPKLLRVDNSASARAKVQVALTI